MSSNKQSMMVTLGIIIISTVSLIMSIHSSYTYLATKNTMIEEMKQSSNITVSSLRKNVSNLIEAYAVNEYDHLVYNEMEPKNIFAIVVEDYKMGKILGRGAYTSGKIRDDDGTLIDFNAKSDKQRQQLETCYYSNKYEITAASGEKLGSISIFISDNEMNEKLNNIIAEALINTAAISLLLILSLFIAIHFFILKPISDIIDVISNSDKDGIPIELFPEYDSQEIFALSSTMNTMITSIRASKIALLEQHNKLREQKNALQYQATHDALTGLANRILFTERLEHLIDKSKDNNTQMALLFVDLDHFKEINDSLGHEAGDKVLRIVTQRLNTTIHNKEALARFGGDEFTVIVEGKEQVEEAPLLADKILKILSEPIIVEHHELYVGCSIGVSLFPDNGDTAQDLLKYADAAMYAAKNEGRNNIRYYSSEMTARALERVVMDTSLRTALKNEEFIVYYQPQINGKTNTLVGMEALVRWQSPSIGLVSPAAFIPIAESTGLIVELDRFVMKSAMTQMAQWYKEGLNPGILAMNLTIKQLQQKDFIDYFKNLITETGCKVECLELEVTEDQIMTNPDEAIDILKQLSATGVKIAVDDFGTGYSSLSYLKKLPINKLKIDQSFISGLPNNEEDAAIAKAIVALAQSLNLEIIAEGVETLEQKEFLVQNGCENIQGYLYSKPIPADKMKEVFLIINES
ncbi:EAL domain-containing protein [Sulfuricurvum sp. RIFCSPLOWO2_12_FULL_43_24]|uniref:putative bifunctional diguanylate cyclase/phosphodiesterase n=1 Tax=Sulfuricurvum sp. RIFCSPLOWO2_12_FULL_43_24 TaxID=1802247 RepID=UPI0025F457EB|nr:EAL domain-containing protein [Sulfuricurvum sp. RIFCSPLOWO2_12_FULL_43_24]